MKITYACLSVLGAILPTVCFTMHFTGRGESAWPEFFQAPFETWVISGFSWDLMVTATACIIWMFRESRRLKIPGIYWHLILVFAVGICLALPTFLLRREYFLSKSEA